MKKIGKNYYRDELLKLKEESMKKAYCVHR